ncbi:MAG: SBBP repeat-containing protein [Pseudomonadota bacterium]
MLNKTAFLLFLIAALQSCSLKFNTPDSSDGDITDTNTNNNSTTGSPVPSSFVIQFGAVTHTVGGNNEGNDSCMDVTTDAEGNIYCAGQTNGSLAEANGGNIDAFVIKTNASGVIQWATQLGAITHITGGSSAGIELVRGVAVDNSGNVYFGGRTNGSLGEANGGSYDAYVAKLNSDGELIWVTQLGATTKGFPGGSNAATDYCSGIDIDGSGNVYCGGYTEGAIGEANGGGEDVFIIKLDPNGVIQWATQLGAVTVAPTGVNNAGNDQCLGVAADSSGAVYCTGTTASSMGEVKSGVWDTYILKLNSDGELQWVTQLGSVTKAPGGNNSGTELCYGVKADDSGNVYASCDTDGSVGEANGGGNTDIFVFKLNSSGALQWITQLGAVTHVEGGDSSGQDNARNVTIDASGNTYTAGQTTGSLGEPIAGSRDMYVMKMNPSGGIEWLTQLGTVTHTEGGDNSGMDACVGIHVDSSGSIFGAVNTNGAMGEANGGSYDAAIVKLDPNGHLN